MSRCKWPAVVWLGGWMGLVAGLSAVPQTGWAQTAGSTQAAPTGELAGKPVEAAPPSAAKGKVLFSRSLEDASGAGTAQPGGGVPTETAASQATAEERASLTFLDYDLDVRLVPRQQSLAVRARLTVRNDGEKPLQRLALQLSSALRWEQVRSGGLPLKFTQAKIDDDADHTGAVNEAVVGLTQQLAPHGELQIEVIYSGTIAQSGERLERIGAPASAAERSDWDELSPEFLGLRGFGNVVWYPVSAPPAMLGDGAKLFALIGKQKQRNQQARVAMTVTSEFTAEAGAPKEAILDGHVVPVVATAAPENAYPGVVTATLPSTVLGFSTPSLFLLTRNKIEANGAQAFAASEDQASAQTLLAMLDSATPLVRQWLGAKPRVPLTVVGLPDANDAPAEEGAVFFTGFKAAPDRQALGEALVHALAHAYFRSSREWLDEGVPQFLGSLWIEQTQGRQAALEALEASRGALALAEPATPGAGEGQDLVHASDTVYYRTKAAYVLWMLRDLAGDAALASALQAYAAQDDVMPEYFEHLVEKASGKDLRWFFESWVYRDQGLPDLSLSGVFPTAASVSGQWLVALDLANDGFAEAEVPVTVRSKETTFTERLRIPARGKLSHRVLIQGIPTEVQLNDGTVPEVQESVHLRRLTVAAP